MKAKILPTSDEKLTEVDIEITPKSFLGKAQTLGETNLIFNKLFETALGLHTRGEEITKIPKKFIGKGVKEEWIKEIKRRVLSQNEELIGAIKGSIESEWAPLTSEIDKSKKGFVVPRNGVLGCTTHKIFFYLPKILGRWESETAPLKQISSIQFTKGLLQGRIHLTVFNDEKVIKWVDNNEGIVITKIIENLCQKEREVKGVVQKEEDPLRILKIRYAKGKISREEYESMKKILK